MTSRLFLSFLGILLWTSGASAFKGFVQVRPDTALYVDFIEPKPGQPTVILLNGLTYATTDFQTFALALAAKGLGVLRFDFDGMGNTLLKYAPRNSIYLQDKPYLFEQQTLDLKALLTKMRLPPPYNFAGLSYGGGIAINYILHFPREVQNLIVISPYTEPLQQQDNWIKGEIALARLNPLMMIYTDDQLYDLFFHQFVLATYPMAEPNVLRNPYALEAAYNLARGIRSFRPVDMAKNIPPGTLHLVMGKNDQYIPQPVFEKFWNATVPRARQSRVLVSYAGHEVSAGYPLFVAGWVNEIIRGNPALHSGISFEANPITMKATGGNGQTIQIQ